MTTKIKVISFDLDDALYDNKPVLFEAERKCNDYLKAQFLRQNIEFNPEDFYKIRHRLLHSDDPAMENMTMMRQVGLTELCRDLNNASLIVEQALAIFLQARSEAVVPDSIYKMLEKLAKSYQLVSVTNGNCDPNKISVGEFFSKNYSPVDGYRAKPHPQMLEQILQDFDLEKNELLHIGDSLKNDGEAAKAAGVGYFQFAPFVELDAVDRTVRNFEKFLKASEPRSI